MTNNRRGKARARHVAIACVFFFATACHTSGQAVGTIGVDSDFPLSRTHAWSIGLDSETWTELAGPGVSLPDVAVTQEVQLDSMTSEPSRPAPVTSVPTASPVRLIYLTTWQGHRFHPETIRRLGRDRGALALMAARVAAILAADQARGVVLDFEQQTPPDLPALLDVIRAVRDSARAHAHSSVITSVVIPAADMVSYPTQPFLSVADYAIIALDDERSALSAPGPLITIDRARRVLTRRVSDAGPGRLIAAFPVYGYVWRPERPAEPITIADARRLATQASVDVIRDPAFYSLHALRAGDWELWIGDAELEQRLETEARGLGITRFGALGAPYAGRR